MSYGSSAGYGGGVLAATGLAAGYLWLVALSAFFVIMGAFLVHFAFRRGRGPMVS